MIRIYENLSKYISEKSKSEQQRKFIFAKRGQYKDKEHTPKKWIWIWEKAYEQIESKLLQEAFTPRQKQLIT